MDRLPNEEITTGYNDLQQAHMSIKAAQKMVGAATMSMDPEQLERATGALEDAKKQFAHAQANATGVDEEFLQQCGQTLVECEHQLREAKV